MVRAAIYPRVSDYEQAEKGVSLHMQRDTCAEYLRRHGWVLVPDERSPDGTYEDIMSGLETDKRAAYQRRVARCRARQVDAVLLFRYDRLGRDDTESISRYNELTKLGGALRQRHGGRTPAGDVQDHHDPGQ